ncbi:hypothetical protein EON80_08490 [bacterium]|nr:MAG: hypothetical protein EON80_08490 [bacterium]
MSAPIPRLRMFAGPNGSGKSTVKAQVNRALWGVFVNADNIEAWLKNDGFFDFESWNVEIGEAELRAFFLQSWVGARLPHWKDEVGKLRFEANRLSARNLSVNSYMAAVIGEILREKLVAQKTSFTFETVMSDFSKVRFLQEARAEGYRTYLYYVATRNPKINVSRVASRVKNGGHWVPEDKIISRYERSLNLLTEAITVCDRVYLWDNSGVRAECFGKFDAGRFIPRSSSLPTWFRTYVLDKLGD